MDNEEVKKRLIAAVERDLGNRASAILKEQILRIINGSKNELNDLEKVLQKIRMSIKLFVDEKLSEKVYKDLRAAANLS